MRGKEVEWKVRGTESRLSVISPVIVGTCAMRTSEFSIEGLRAYGPSFGGSLKFQNSKIP